jgi:transposase
VQINHAMPELEKLQTAQNAPKQASHELLRLKGRDFAAWVGLTPRQHSSGCKERLGRTSKMGQRDIRRLLIIGAVAVVRWAARKGAPEGSWLARMLERKPKMLVAVALANRMARTAWALMRKGEDYRNPAGATA